MLNIAMSTGGRITIPSKIRRRLNIKKGTRICVLEKEQQIILQPLTQDYFERHAGIIKTQGKLLQTLSKERGKSCLLKCFVNS